MDGTLCRRNVTHTVIAFGEVYETDRRKVCEYLFADRAVYFFIRVFRTQKQKQQIENFRLIIKTRKSRRTGKDDIDRTHARRLRRFRIVAEFAARVHVHNDSTVRRRADEFGILCNRLCRYARRVAQRIND